MGPVELSYFTLFGPLSYFVHAHSSQGNERKVKKMHVTKIILQIILMFNFAKEMANRLPSFRFQFLFPLLCARKRMNFGCICSV